jgi:hypothetical protein
MYIDTNNRHTRKYYFGNIVSYSHDFQSKVDLFYYLFKRKDICGLIAKIYSDKF